MKQYFVEGVENPVEEGDVLGLTFEKEGEESKTIEVTCTPGVLEMLAELGLATVKTTEDEDKVIENGEYFDLLESCITNLTDLAEAQEKDIKELKEKTEALADAINKQSKRSTFFL